MRTDRSEVETSLEPADRREALVDEQQRIRRLRLVVDLVAQVIAADPDLDFHRARILIEGCRTAAISLFPGSEEVFDIVVRGRLERILLERFASGVVN